MSDEEIERLNKRMENAEKQVEMVKERLPYSKQLDTTQKCDEDDQIQPTYLSDKNKKSNKKVVITIVGIVAVILAVMGAILLKLEQERKFRVAQENQLRAEVMELNMLDPATDTVDMTMKTKGDYQEVERTIKEYYKDICTTTQHFVGMSSDERFTILSDGFGESYWNDAPDFTKTTEAITVMKAEVEKDCDDMNALTEKKNIEDRMNQKLEQRYIDLYDELMLSDSTLSQLDTVKVSIEKSKTQLISMLDKRQEVVDCLVSHKGEWERKDGDIYFHSKEAVDEYNALVDQLNGAANQ